MATRDDMEPVLVLGSNPPRYELWATRAALLIRARETLAAEAMKIPLDVLAQRAMRVHEFFTSNPIMGKVK